MYRIEDRLAIRLGIESAIEIEIGAGEYQPAGHPLQSLQASATETVSASLTGATGRGANTEPLLSMMAMTFSPFWCLWPE